MSWTEELYKIYEQQCGRTENENDPLLPIGHSTANAQIEVTLSDKGEFITAVRVDKSDAVTVIPVTEDSGPRGMGVFPHPFADKLVYIAGDYPKYTDGKRSDNAEYFKAYIDGLRGWAESEHSHPAVRAALRYLSGKTLITDLVSARALELDENGLLKKDVKIANIAQEDCFVRFRVNYAEGGEPKTWADTTLYDAYIAYNSTRFEKNGLCYALGRELPVTYKHPSKLRNAGDKGKLISTNDESGFTYRGRFANKEQAVSVSYEFSQKVHNALKWLIARQGITVDSLSLVVWESALQPLPDITKSLDECFGEFGLDDFEEEPQQLFGDNLVSAYRDKLKKSIFGRENELKPGSKTMLMALDSATTGRVSMSMYTELSTSDFLGNIGEWHENTAWVRYNGRKNIREINSFSLAEIAECAFGTEQGGYIACKPEVKRDVYLRLIPCVTEGRSLPQDIVSALVNRASNPQMYDKDYNWRRVLETACGMIRKKQIEKTKEECSMALDKESTSRDYLFGRLLAVADAAEASTYDKDNRRTTNARRYFNAFANRPSSGWQTIYSRLEPYLNKMPEQSRLYYTKLINEITGMFEHEDFNDNSKLKPEFLHAYSCQLNEIYSGNKNGSADITNDNDDNKED